MFYVTKSSLKRLFHVARDMSSEREFCCGLAPEGALGYFLGGYVPPGTPNWHSVLRRKEYNSLLVNALHRIFKSNLSLNNFKWLLTKLELSCVRNIIPRARKRL